MHLLKQPKPFPSTPTIFPQLFLLPNSNTTNATAPNNKIINHPKPNAQISTTYHHNGTATIEYKNGTKITYTQVPEMKMDGVDVNYRHTWEGNVVMFSPFIFLGIVLGVVLFGTGFKCANPMERRRRRCACW
jgi:hypothetical protein